MKKLIYLLLLPLVVAVTACGGKVNSKKESVLATQDSVDARGIQRMQTSKSEIDIKFKGKDYRSFVARQPEREQSLCQLFVGRYVPPMYLDRNGRISFPIYSGHGTNETDRCLPQQFH